MTDRKMFTLWEMTGHSEVIVLIGAGGKTTTLQSLAEELHAQGVKVIGTTTTKVYPMRSDFWNLWEHPHNPPSTEAGSPCFWYNRENEDKWIGPSVDAVDQALKERAPGCVWIIEGDGAREKKLKCWESYEPQIPALSQTAILVISGELWGKTLTNQEVHRPEKCPEIMGKPWTPERAASYILSSPVFSLGYQELSWIVLFNKFVSLKSDIDNEQRNIEEPNIEEPNIEEPNIEETIKTMLKYKEYLRESDQRGIPKHLRFAIGDVKKGNLRCYDLW